MMKKLILSIVFLTLSSAAHADITTGLIGWWKFDEGSGTTANDSSGSGYTGTLTNTPTWIPGKIGTNALSFSSASSQYVSVGSHTALTTVPYTETAWVNLINTSTVYPIIGGSAADYYQFRINTGGAPKVIDQVNGNASATSTGTVTAGVWTLVGFTYDGTNYVFYINGASAGSGTLNSSYLSNSTTQVGGATVLSQYMNGYMDDVRIYNRVLSASDMSQLYGIGAQLHQFSHAHLANFKTSFY